METKVIIEMPLDPYDPAWAAFNEAHPHMPKSVGAAAADGDDNSDDDSEDDENEDTNDDENEDTNDDENEDTNDGENEDDDNEDDGDKPSEREAALLKESMARKKRIKEQTAQIKALEDKLKQFDGLDVEQMKKLAAQAEKAEEEQLTKKGEFETLKKRMSEAHKAEIEAKDKAIAELNDKFKEAAKKMDDLTVGRAFSDDAFIRDKLVLTPTKARVIYGSHFEINEDGQLLGYTKPVGTKGAEPLVDAAGDPIPFTKAIQQLVEADPDKDSILKSTMKPGSDSKPAKDGGDAKPGGGKGDLKGVSKIEAGLKGDDKDD